MDDIEYLEEYEDLIIPNIDTGREGTEKNLKKRVPVSDDESSSSIDQDIFERLFDNQSDDESEVINKNVKPIEARRETRESLDSLDMLVRDLGENVETLDVASNPPIKEIKPTTSCLKKSISEESRRNNLSADGTQLPQKKKRVMFACTTSPGASPSDANAGAHYSVTGRKPIETARDLTPKNQRKFNRPQPTIVRPEKVQFRDPANDPLSLENQNSDLESISDESNDSFASLSEIFGLSKEEECVKGNKDSNNSMILKPDSTNQLFGTSGATAPSLKTNQKAPSLSQPVPHISTEGLPEKVTIISDTILTRIDTAFLESLASDESKEIFAKENQKLKASEAIQLKQPDLIDIIDDQEKSKDTETNLDYQMEKEQNTLTEHKIKEGIEDLRSDKNSTTLDSLSDFPESVSAVEVSSSDILTSSANDGLSRDKKSETGALSTNAFKKEKIAKDSQIDKLELNENIKDENLETADVSHYQKENFPTTNETEKVLREDPQKILLEEKELAQGELEKDKFSQTQEEISLTKDAKQNSTIINDEVNVNVQPLEPEQKPSLSSTNKSVDKSGNANKTFNKTQTLKSPLRKTNETEINKKESSTKTGETRVKDSDTKNQTNKIKICQDSAKNYELKTQLSTEQANAASKAMPLEINSISMNKSQEMDKNPSKTLTTEDTKGCDAKNAPGPIDSSSDKNELKDKEEPIEAEVANLNNSTTSLKSTSLAKSNQTTAPESNRPTLRRSESSCSTKSDEEKAKLKVDQECNISEGAKPLNSSVDAKITNRITLKRQTSSTSIKHSESPQVKKSFKSDCTFESPKSASSLQTTPKMSDGSNRSRPLVTGNFAPKSENVVSQASNNKAAGNNKTLLNKRPHEKGGKPQMMTTGADTTVKDITTSSKLKHQCEAIKISTQQKIENVVTDDDKLKAVENKPVNVSVLKNIKGSAEIKNLKSSTKVHQKDDKTSLNSDTMKPIESKPTKSTSNNKIQNPNKPTASPSANTNKKTVLQKANNPPSAASPISKKVEKCPSDTDIKKPTVNKAIGGSAQAPKNILTPPAVDRKQFKSTTNANLGIQKMERASSSIEIKRPTDGKASGSVQTGNKLVRSSSAIDIKKVAPKAPVGKLQASKKVESPAVGDGKKKTIGFKTAASTTGSPLIHKKQQSTPSANDKKQIIDSKTIQECSGGTSNQKKIESTALVDDVKKTKDIKEVEESRCNTPAEKKIEKAPSAIDTKEVVGAGSLQTSKKIDKSPSVQENRKPTLNKEGSFIKTPSDFNTRNQSPKKSIGVKFAKAPSNSPQPLKKLEKTASNIEIKKTTPVNASKVAGGKAQAMTKTESVPSAGPFKKVTEAQSSKNSNANASGPKKCIKTISSADSNKAKDSQTGTISITSDSKKTESTGDDIKHATVNKNETAPSVKFERAASTTDIKKTTVVKSLSANTPTRSQSATSIKKTAKQETMGTPKSGTDECVATVPIKLQKQNTAPDMKKTVVRKVAESSNTKTQSPQKTLAKTNSAANAKNNPKEEISKNTIVETQGQTAHGQKDQCDETKKTMSVEDAKKNSVSNQSQDTNKAPVSVDQTKETIRPNRKEGTIGTQFQEAQKQKFDFLSEESGKVTHSTESKEVSGENISINKQDKISIEQLDDSQIFDELLAISMSKSDISQKTICQASRSDVTEKELQKEDSKESEPPVSDAKDEVHTKSRTKELPLEVTATQQLEADMSSEEIKNSQDQKNDLENLDLKQSSESTPLVPTVGFESDSQDKVEKDLTQLEKTIKEKDELQQNKNNKVGTKLSKRLLRKRGNDSNDSSQETVYNEQSPSRHLQKRNRKTTENELAPMPFKKHRTETNIQELHDGSPARKTTKGSTVESKTQPDKKQANLSVATAETKTLAIDNQSENTVGDQKQGLNTTESLNTTIENISGDFEMVAENATASIEALSDSKDQADLSELKKSDIKIKANVGSISEPSSAAPNDEDIVTEMSPTKTSSAVITFTEWLAQKSKNQNPTTTEDGFQDGVKSETKTNSKKTTEQKRQNRKVKSEIEILKASMSKDMREGGIDELIRSHASSPCCLTKRSVAALNSAFVLVEEQKRLALAPKTRSRQQKSAELMTIPAAEIIEAITKTTTGSNFFPKSAIPSPNTIVSKMTQLTTKVLPPPSPPLQVISAKSGHSKTKGGKRNSKVGRKSGITQCNLHKLKVRINRAEVRKYFTKLKTKTADSKVENISTVPNSSINLTPVQEQSKGKKRKASPQQPVQQTSKKIATAKTTATHKTSVKKSTAVDVIDKHSNSQTKSSINKQQVLSTTTLDYPIATIQGESAVPDSLLTPVTESSVEKSETSRRGKSKRSNQFTSSVVSAISTDGCKVITPSVSGSGPISSILPETATNTMSPLTTSSSSTMAVPPIPLIDCNVAPKTEYDDYMDTSRSETDIQAATGTVNMTPTLENAKNIVHAIPSLVPPDILKPSCPSSTNISTSSVTSAPLVISGITSNNLPPIIMDNAGTRLYSFLHPMKYNASHGCVMLDYCCPNLDEPMTAIDPTRRHAKVDAAVRELPAYITMETRLVTRAELEADSSALPASIRHKVQRITGRKSLNSKATNDTGSTLTAAALKLSSNSTNVQSVSSLTLTALQKQLPATTTLTPKTMTVTPPNASTSSTSTFKTTQSSGASSVPMPKATIQPANMQEMRSKLRVSLKKYDVLLKKHYHRISLLNFTERQNIMESLANSTQLLPRDVDNATRLLQEYVTHMTINTAAVSTPTTATAPLSRSAVATTTTVVTPVATSTSVSSLSGGVGTPINTRASSKRGTGGNESMKMQRKSVPIYGADKSVIGYQVQMVAAPSGNSSVSGIKTNQTSIPPKTNTPSATTSTTSTITTRRSGIFVIDNGNGNKSSPNLTGTTPTNPYKLTSSSIHQTPRMTPYTKREMHTSTPNATISTPPTTLTPPANSSVGGSGGGSMLTRSGLTSRIGSGVTVKHITTRTANSKLSTPTAPVTITTTTPPLLRLPKLTRNPHLPPIASGASNKAATSLGNTPNFGRDITTKRVTRNTGTVNVGGTSTQTTGIVVYSQDPEGNRIPATTEESILPDECNNSTAQIKREQPDDY